MTVTRTVPQFWGMIRDSVAVSGTGVYDMEGTVTCDGVGVTDDTDTLKINIAGKYLVQIHANNDADPPSGFTYWLFRVLKNGTPIGDDGVTYVNAYQTYSGGGGPVTFSMNKDGSTHIIVDCAVNDIITGEVEDLGDTNGNSCNITYTITAHYLGV